MPCAVPFNDMRVYIGRNPLLAKLRRSGQGIAAVQHHQDRHGSARIGGARDRPRPLSFGVSATRPEIATTPATSSSRRGATCSDIIAPWEKPAGQQPAREHIFIDHQRIKVVVSRSSTACACRARFLLRCWPSNPRIGNHWKPFAWPAPLSGGIGGQTMVSGKCFGHRESEASAGLARWAP